MLISTLILGWFGVFLFLIIVFSFRKLAANNEFAALHLIMAVMYAMWLPLPIALYQLLDSELLLTGTIFGLTYLLMLIITMTLQVGHISYITKHHVDQKQGEYMMATLSNPYEMLVNVFKCIWALFLAITFWKNDELFMAVMMTLFSLLLFYYLLLILQTSITKQIKLLSKVKPNPFLINIETLLFFILLMSYISF